MLRPVSKLFRPGRETVELRPSRIRREPVRLAEKVEPASREREIAGGIAGVLLFAIALAVAIVGVSIATIFHDDPGAAARADEFGQCYNGGLNCVLDGGTIHVAGETVAIAGIAAPAIRGAQCDHERSRGIDAAVRLAALLNGGTVTMSAPFPDQNGRDVRKVLVSGRDVGQTMISAGLARPDNGGRPNWCD
jgi:endonuclease YncB( thermonuclease family)